MFYHPLRGFRPPYYSKSVAGGFVHASDAKFSQRSEITEVLSLALFEGSYKAPSIVFSISAEIYTCLSSRVPFSELKHSFEQA